MSVKKSETADTTQDGIRELSLHEYDLVAGGDGDGDGDSSEYYGSNPDVENGPSGGSGSLHNYGEYGGGANSDR